MKLLQQPFLINDASHAYIRFCASCQEHDPARTVTLKPPARKSTRKKLARDYANMHTGLSSSDPNRWLNMLQGKPIADDHFRRLNGEQVNLDWVNGNPDAFREPVVIEEPEGLGMKMPGRDLSIESIADTLGRDTPVEVIGTLSLPCRRDARCSSRLHDFCYRCSLTVEFSRLDPRQVGKLLVNRICIS